MPFHSIQVALDGKARVKAGLSLVAAWGGHIVGTKDRCCNPRAIHPAYHVRSWSAAESGKAFRDLTSTLDPAQLHAAGCEDRGDEGAERMDLPRSHHRGCNSNARTQSSCAAKTATGVLEYSGSDG
jgi:hypothetical protein